MLLWSLACTGVWMGAMLSLMRWWGGDWPWGSNLSGYEEWMIPASLFSGMAVSGLVGWATRDLPYRKSAPAPLVAPRPHFEVREVPGGFEVTGRGVPFETADRELAVMVRDQWAREFKGEL